MSGALLRRGGACAVLLLAVGASAQDYKRTHVKGAQLCIYWPNRSYVYQADAAGYSQITDGSAFTAMDASFQSWQALSDWCSGFTFTRGDRIQNAQTGYVAGGPNHNVIIFREQNCASTVPAGDRCLADLSCANAYRCWDHPDQAIAITTATYSPSSGTILDADIELNASVPATGGMAYVFTTVDSPACTDSAPSQSCSSSDIQNTLTHEIGHVIGLDHVPNPASTMYATANIGETRKRIIDSGTAAGFCDIYPRASASTPICDLSAQVDRQITGTSSGTAAPNFSCAVGGSAPGAPWAGVLLWAAAGLRRRMARRNGLRADTR